MRWRACPFGGGKAVIIGDSAQARPRSCSRPLAVSSTPSAGRYITAEDVGTTTADMEACAPTRFVSGPRARTGRSRRGPGPKTALGVYLGIKAAAKFRLGRSDLAA